MLWSWEAAFFPFFLQDVSIRRSPTAALLCSSVALSHSLPVTVSLALYPVRELPWLWAARGTLLVTSECLLSAVPRERIVPVTSWEMFVSNLTGASASLK